MSKQEITDEIDWTALRFTVTTPMYQDLKKVVKSKGVTMAAFIRPLIREAIEAHSKTLDVGSKRKKED